MPEIGGPLRQVVSREWSLKTSLYGISKQMVISGFLG